MINNSIVDSISKALLVGGAGYIGSEIAKKLNLTEIWERNVPLNTSQDRVIESKMEINLLTGISQLDLLRQVPVMNEMAVSSIGAIFGAAIGFAGIALVNYLEGKSGS